MAQQDTGLGWSAKSEWLLVNRGTIANLETIDPTIFPNQPLGIGTSTTDFANRGFYFAYNAGHTEEEYALASTDNSPVYAFKTSNNYAIFCTKAQNMTVYLASKRISDGHFFTPINFTLSNHSGDWYYIQYRKSGSTIDFLPVYSNVNTGLEALNAAIIGSPVEKTNAGYCVGSLVTWYTPEGVEQISPILISTDEDAAEMSMTGYTSYKNIRHYDGLTFYMSMFVNLPHDLTSTMVAADFRQFGAAAPSKIFALLAAESFANIVVITSPDPYKEPTGESEEGGGDGEEDDANNVDFTDPPSTSIGATGLLTIFCPNLYQLQSLGNYMWSTFDVDNWRKIIANPMDAILGLHTIPIPAVITGTKAVKVAGIDTTIDMSYTTVRYIRRSMGTCEIPKKWGAYLDYSPYTKISIFLPFIGFKELDADDIMGKTIALQYMIDILTGACVAELKCGDTVLYSWSGNCANEVPISGSDWRGAIASAIGIAATVAGTALVTGGATAPMAASMVASVGANSMNLKPTINRSGAISGSAGYMGQKRPYIIRSIPNLVIPTDQNKFIGYPSFVTASLGSLTGYNEISSIHLEGIPATGNELAEIETLLKGGVIF